MAKAFEASGWDVSVITVYPANIRFRERSDSLLLYVSDKTDVIRIKDTVSYRLWVESNRVIARLRLKSFFRKIVKAALQVWARLKWPAEYRQINALRKRTGASFLLADMVWVCPAIREGLKLNACSPLDVVISTMPPHMSGTVAYELYQQAGIPYVLDYRDLFVGHPFGDPPVGDGRLEDLFLENPLLVLGVTEGITQLLSKRTQSPVEFFPNGFDADLFKEYLALSQEGTDGQLKLVHAGTLYEGCGLSSLISALENLPPTKYLLTLAGSIDKETSAALKQHEVSAEVRGTISAEAAHQLVATSDVTIAVGLKDDTGVIRAKIFEMLALKKPTLYVGKDADEGAHLLKRCGLLVGCAQSVPELETIIKNLVKTKTEGRAFCKPNDQEIKKYSLGQQGPRLVSLVEEALR